MVIEDTTRDRLASGAWAALEGSFAAMIAGGLPCGAALVDQTGTVIAGGRNQPTTFAMVTTSSKSRPWLTLN